MKKENVENDKIEIKEKDKAFDIVRRIICLLIPIVFAFGGYFLSPYIWKLLNHTTEPGEVFKFICSLIFMAVPTMFIFIHTRNLNPTIRITIKDKNKD